MSKDIAVVDENGIVIAINRHRDDYELKQNEILVTNSAFINGDYVNGYFYEPQPYPSWIRNNGYWNSPIPKPNNDKIYTWNESTLSWVEVAP